MRESIHKYFKIGTVQWMSHPPADYDVLESIKELACDDFFTAIEVKQFADDETREKARDMLAQSGMAVRYGAQPRLLGPGLNPNDVDEEQRQKAEDTLMEAIDEAEYLGSPGMTFLSGHWSEETKEENYKQLLKTTRNLCDHAATKNMIVQIEVFDFDMDKKSLLGPAPYAAKFAADMRTTHNNFGLMVDLSHLPTTYETSKFAIRTMRPYITHFHIGNAVVEEGKEGYGDLHPRFGYPNSANDVAELTEFFTVLKEEGFFRPENPYVLSIEVMPRPHEDGDIILANTKRAVNRAWAMVED